jgi:NTE family protein
MASATVEARPMEDFDMSDLPNPEDDVPAGSSIRSIIRSAAFANHTGTYWGIRTDFADYKLATDPLKCLTRESAPLAKIPTRLEKMPRDVQNRLMNWGYAICDAALRAHVDAPLRKKLGIQITDTDKFPFPGGY